jgi:hypothetical protein
MSRFAGFAAIVESASAAGPSIMRSVIARPVIAIFADAARTVMAPTCVGPRARRACEISRAEDISLRSRR